MCPHVWMIRGPQLHLPCTLDATTVEETHFKWESRREITALAGEKHPSPWQGSTGLSSLPKYARHRENPQAQSVSTASSPELSREKKPLCEDVVTVLHKSQAKIKPRVLNPSHLQLSLAQHHLGLCRTLQARVQVCGQPAGDAHLPQAASSPSLHLLVQEQLSWGEQLICHRIKVNREVSSPISSSLRHLKDRDCLQRC